MLTLINSNRMAPPIAPIGLDYLSGAIRRAGINVTLLDLALEQNSDSALASHLSSHSPELIAISFRNVDDCFWPGAAWFVPQLNTLVQKIRQLANAPIVLGGVGFSIFAEEIFRRTGADFGVRGDGEPALPALLAQLHGQQRYELVPGLIWRKDNLVHANSPAWPRELAIPTARDTVDNPTYFRLGGQIGLETKRGCGRRCVYCADPFAKGSVERLRNPARVVNEIQSLLARGIDVLHLCDSEFNVPPAHAHAVCDEIIRRRLGDRIRWYTYMAVTPFDAQLADRMRRAGCAGINFTADSASPALLAAHGHAHRKPELARCVQLCRSHGISVMLDLLIGSPGETPDTLCDTIRFVQQIDPDCAGAALGVRLYPETPLTLTLAAKGQLTASDGVHRCYEGSLDLLCPTFYISPALGDSPAQLVRDFIGGDSRFFAPEDESPAPSSRDDSRKDHNYNANQALVDAIAAGERGAYWHILQRLRSNQ